MRQLESRIEAVTVFRQGAQVTRCAELLPENGEWPAQVRLVGLPLGLDDQSLRIRASFPQGGGGVLATELRVDLDLTDPGAPLLEKTDLRPLQSRRRRLQLELEQVNDDLRSLGSLEPPGRPANPVAGEPPVPFSLDSRRTLVELRQAQLRRLGDRSLQLRADLEKLDREMAAIGEAERKAQAPPRQESLRKAVVVALRLGAEVSAPALRLHLTYSVAGARWTPSYTLRFDRDVTMAELSMRAAVCQSSGEDWQGVALSVSTADPTSWRELPELVSKRIGRQQPPPSRAGWRPPPLGTDALYADLDRAPARRTLTPPPAPPSFGADPFAVPACGEAQFLEVEPCADLALDLALELDEEVPVAAEMARGGATTVLARSAPPPPPPPPPPPAAAPQSTPVRAGLVRMEMAAKPKMMMARESSPPVVQQKARRWQDEVRGGGGGPPQGRPAPLPPSWDAQPDQLAYGLLRLPAYDEYGRGKLQSQTPMQACLRLWKAAHPNLTFDPAQVLQSALQASRKALQVQPLESHRLPTAVTGFDYLYPGESPVDLPTDAEFHSLPLLKRQLTARLQFVSVPKKTTDVFRLAEVESLPDLAMPAGPVDVFVGRDYLLTTTLADVAPGERVNLGLGVEQGIKVARNTSYKESTSGMLGGTLLLRHSLDVEVANRLSREVRLEVREVVPQARPDQDEVKVRVESSEPPWHGSATEGRYRWNVSLPAGDKLTLKAVYVIEMPAKLELLGGNRREE